MCEYIAKKYYTFIIIFDDTITLRYNRLENNANNLCKVVHQFKSIQLHRELLLEFD